MWTFWPVIVISFLASFSVGHKQIRPGCNKPKPPGLQCETDELDLETVKSSSERYLNKTLVKGAAIEHFQWKQQKEQQRTDLATGTTSVRITEERLYPFSIGIVEYDDQGRAWSGDQVDAVKAFVTKRTTASDALIVTFIHGWKNDCATCNGNLTCFRDFLAVLAGVEDDLAKFVHAQPRLIIGVYVGWRGETMRIKYADALSAFGRKAAADRVGGSTSDLTSFLSWLNEAKVKADTTVVSERHTSPMGTRLVVVGHSFGADVLFGAIAGHLNAQLGASEAQRPGPRADGPELSAQAFADLTVLVNPALEASKYHSFAERVNATFAKRQPPLIVTVQATNDPVTHYVFPIERAIVSLPDSTASKADYGAALAAVGHYADYYTHTLCQPGKPGPPKCTEQIASTLLKGLVDKPVKITPTPCGCDSFEASRDAHAALLLSVRSALQHLPDGDVHIGDPLVGWASDLEPMAARPVNVNSPLLVVRATPDVVDKHSGIYRGQLFDFLANMLLRVQLLQNQGLREQMLSASSPSQP